LIRPLHSADDGGVTLYAARAIGLSASCHWFWHIHRLPLVGYSRVQFSFIRVIHGLLCRPKRARSIS